jgi:hypothetical protein
MLRKVGKYLFGSLFTLSLIFLISVHSFAQFTEYNNLKRIVTKIIEPSVESKLNYTIVLRMCEYQEKIEFYIENIGNVSVTCDSIKQAGQEKFLALFTDVIFDKLYSKEYTCDFIGCLKEQPLVIVSSYANSFFMSLEVPLMLSTIILAIVYLMLEETNTKRLKGFGYILLVCGVQFFLLYYIKDFFVKQTPILEILNFLFSSMTFYYTLALVFGASLFIVGYILEKKLKA